VQTRTVSGVTQPQAVDVVAFVVSAGRNGYYAWDQRGVAQGGPASPDTRDEGRNRVFFDPGPARWRVASDAIVVDRPVLRTDAACDDIAGGGANLCEFDDLVIAIGRSTLVGRMAAAGRL
jgi:hypothetical protein